MVDLDLTGRLPSGLNRKQLLRLAETALKTTRFQGPARLSVSIVDEAAIRRLNRRYRGQNRSTDVLSFASKTDPRFVVATGSRPIEHLGDVVISRPHVKRQARQVGRTMAQEFALLFIHGLLHLLGYDHATARRERAMFALQQEIMIRAGLW